MELGNPRPELAIIYMFFNGLDTSYQIWKDRYLGDYSKDNIIKNEKIIVLMIKEILKLLIDRESKAKISITSKSTTRAFKAFQEKAKEPKERRNLFKGEKKDYI